jgi:hypothetical protein
VRVGVREGVCRDFAVLGYCEKGLDCEHQHVRECPDFAERSACTTKGCKLPHVIRANRNRPRPVAAVNADSSMDIQRSDTAAPSSGADLDTSAGAGSRTLTAEDAQLGDEFISLTFHESEIEEDEEEDDEDEESEGEEQTEEDEESPQHEVQQEE